MDPMEQMTGASGPVPSNFSGETAGNYEDIEKQFAVKVVHHMQTYWAVLEKVPGSSLRLTKLDAEILDHLYRDFPDFDPAATIEENSLKSASGKKKWREFMMAYENRVEDFNFGTMLRTNPNTDYEEENTIFVPRMQFFAIEIARNKKGLNDWIYEKNKAQA